MDSTSSFFVVSFSLSLMLNYYTAYMIAFFGVIYFLYRVCSGKIDRKSVMNSFFTLAVSSVLSVMISAWLWLPVFIDFGRGKLAEGNKQIDLFIRNYRNNYFPLPMTELILLMHLRYIAE